MNIIYRLNLIFLLPIILYFVLISPSITLAACSAAQLQEAYETCISQNNDNYNFSEDTASGDCNEAKYRTCGRINNTRAPSATDLCPAGASDPGGKCDDNNSCTVDYCSIAGYGRCDHRLIPNCSTAPFQDTFTPNEPVPAVPAQQAPSQVPPAQPQQQTPSFSPIRPNEPVVPPVPRPEPQQPAPPRPTTQQPQPAPAPQPKECKDPNSCTEASIGTNGECVYNPYPDGKVCGYDGFNGNPTLACVQGRCAQELAQPPAPLPAYSPVQPQTVETETSRRPKPTEPRSTQPTYACNFEGTNYTPGEKRYECLEPREQGSCELDAGFGVPYICSKDGSWEAGNNSLAECSQSCAVNYSPVIVDIAQQNIPTNDQCFGELYYKCGEENQNILMPSWFLADNGNSQSCNVFIRDEFGDHVISNLCNSSWYGNEIPGGAQVKDGGTYELYVSNGTETCFNQLAAKAQLKCETPTSVINEEPSEQSPQEEEQLFPWVPWLSELL